MILTEIITEDRYEFLKLWYLCKWMIWDKYPESIFMVRDGEVLFQQDWKYNILWCSHSIVWSVFESKFGYDDLQIEQMISSVLVEHLKKGALIPCFSKLYQVEEHFKKQAHDIN